MPPQRIRPATARRYAQAVQTKLDTKTHLSKRDIQPLLDAALSLASQLEDTRIIVADARRQREQNERLVQDWNALFAALRRVGLQLCEEPDGGIAYQWRGGALVRGFAGWAQALEAALRAITPSSS